MLYKHTTGLLPKKQRLGETSIQKRSALKHLSSHNLKLRQQIFRKLTILPKLGILGWVVLYFMGYQPVLKFPPTIKQSVVHADFSEQQRITPSGFTHPFQLPHSGYLTTPFSAWHPGVDLAISLDTPIHPINDGVVIDVQFSFDGLGHFVVIQHEQGYQSVYGHMGKIFVTVGQKVTVDTILGEVGLTGRTTGPHTHLEVSKDGVKINPLIILPAPQKLPVMSYIESSTSAQNPVIIQPVKPSITSNPANNQTQSDDHLDLKKELSFNL